MKIKLLQNKFAAVVSLFLVMTLSGCSSDCDNTAPGGEVAQQQTFKWKLVTTWPKHFPA